jgi:dethiobiotin synthetase
VRGVFVTGTDTGVGKSIVAAAICAWLVSRGEGVAAFKPVVTGLDDEPRGDWPPDHELLASAAGGRVTADRVTPYTFGPPLSPHFAAELSGRTIEAARIREAAGAAAEGADALVCEGVGGLLVPLTPDYSVRDLAVDLGLPLVVAARTGLGTISHSLLTVEAARATGLTVAAVVMTPWSESPQPIEESNRRTVERIAGVPVCGLPVTEPSRLAAAAEALPIADWL